MASSHPARMREMWRRILDRFRKKPEPPEDPHAYVMAPKRPRPSGRSAAAVLERPEE